MIKATFTSEQQPVKVMEYGDKLFVFICLNGVPKIYDCDDYENDENEVSEKYIEYEYDYNEFMVKKDYINIEDVIANPEKYLNYPLPKVTDMEQLRADVDYLLMLNE